MSIRTVHSEYAPADQAWSAYEVGGDEEIIGRGLTADSAIADLRALTEARLEKEIAELRAANLALAEESRQLQDNPIGYWRDRCNRSEQSLADTEARADGFYARLTMIRDAAKDGASLTWIRAVADEGLRGEPLAKLPEVRS